MRYKNTKTGAIVDSSSKIVGKNWVEVTGEVGDIQKNAETNEEYVEEEINLEEMTNKELEDFAEEHGIKLTADDKKNKATRIEAIAKEFE